jgi:hypothetical protein
MTLIRVALVAEHGTVGKAYHPVFSPIATRARSSPG